MLSIRARWLLGFSVAGVALLGPALVDACGLFRSNRSAPEQTPSLAREQVLLIHDADTKREHFIREIVFVRGHERFGFVIPTPTRAEVAEVATSPFKLLRQEFPIAAIPRGGAPQSATQGVDVLEVSRVGSFTAFVLAADDADALGKWLVDNELVSDPETNAWLDHYVALGFHYVALRYDPPPPSTRESVPSSDLVAETVRISFSTPLPYYPYLEPIRAAAVEPRLLELWLVGTEPVVPISLRDRDDTHAWVQPLQRGPVARDVRTKLEAALEPELEALLPAGPLIVQTFQDQKRSRAGFGDVVFGFQAAQPLTPELTAELEPLLGLLDPALVNPKEPTP